MSEMNASNTHGLDMAVQVVQTATGKVEAHVAECDLERFGFGLDPLVAVERYKSEMEADRVRAGDDTPSWLDTAVTVYPDEEYGYPIERYHLTFDGVLLTTRKEKALRLFAQYLLDIANGIEQDDSMFVGGTGLELAKETD